MRELRTYLEGRVDLQRLLDQLGYNPDDLERANLKQPKLYLTASQLRAQLMKEASRAKRRYDHLVAKHKMKLRRQNSGRGRGDKLTEGALSDTVAMILAVRKARVRKDNAEALEEWGKLLVDSFRQRRDSIRNMIDIRSGEINNEIQQVRRNMERKSMDRVRKKARDRFRELNERDDDG